MARSMTLRWLFMACACTLGFGAIPLPASAAAIFTYEGYLEEDDGLGNMVPVTTSQSFTVHIQNAANGCNLYSETHSVTPVEGRFSLKIGTGTSVNFHSTSPQNLPYIFSNGTNIGSCGLDGATGLRQLRIYLNGSTDLGAMVITSAPMAMFATSAGSAQDAGKLDGSPIGAFVLRADVPICDPATEAVTWNGTLFTCKNIVSIPATCGANEILKFNGSAWACATDSTGGGATTDASLLTDGTLNSARLPIVPVAKGGTGVSALGTANQILGVNAAGSAAEYKSITGGAGVTIAHSAGGIQIAIAAGGVSTSELAANAVTTAKINALAVTDDKINNMGVQKITSSAGSYFSYMPNNAPCATDETLKWDGVGTRWICGAAGGAGISALTGDVTASGTGSVVATLANNAVTTGKINDGAVTDSKITSVGVQKITSSSGHYFSYMPGGTPCTAGDVLKLSSGNWVCGTDNGGSLPSLSHGMAWLGDGTNSATSRYLFLSDIRSMSGANPPLFDVSGCGDGQTLRWFSATDQLACVDIRVTDASMSTVVTSTIYVRSGGSDTNCNGTSSSVGSAPNCAFATLQRAIDSLPPYINHNTTIDVDGTFTLDKPVVIGKRGHYAQNAFLYIKSAGTAATFVASGPSGITGLIILPNARNVHLQKLNFNGFSGASGPNEGTAIHVAGGMVLLEDVGFNNNHTAISVRNGAAHFMGGASVVTLSTDSKATGFSVRGGEIGSMPGASLIMNTDSSSSQQTLVRVELGAASFSGSLTLNRAPNCQPCSAISVEDGGILHAEGGLIVTGGTTSSNMSPLVSIRGGHMTTSGASAAQFIDWGNSNAISVEDGGRLVLYGSTIFNGNSSTASPLTVRSKSALRVENGLQINANSASQGLIMVQDQSSASFRVSNTGLTWQFIGAAPGAAIRASGQSHVTFSNEHAPVLDVSSMAAFIDASGASRFDFFNSGGSSTYTQVGPTDDIRLDATSSAAIPNNIIGLSVTGGIGDVPIYPTGGGSSYTSLNGSITDGRVFSFVVGAVNSANPVLNVNGTNIPLVNANTGLSLSDKDMAAGVIHRAYYVPGLNHFKVILSPKVIRPSVNQSIPFSSSLEVDLLSDMPSGQASCSPQSSLPSEVSIDYVRVENSTLKIRFRNHHSSSPKTVNTMFDCIITPAG